MVIADCVNMLFENILKCMQLNLYVRPKSQDLKGSSCDLLLATLCDETLIVRGFLIGLSLNLKVKFMPTHIQRSIG